MPNGLVIGNPGDTYTDTAGTNGAWKWRKASGTGNTGWVVVDGDTGWRSIPVSDITNWHANYGNGFPVKVRRVNELFMVRFESMNATTGGPMNNVRILTLPPSVTNMAPFIFSNRGSLYGMGGRASNVMGNFVNTLSDINVTGFYADHTSAATLTGPCFDPWPTTLPGTAA
jgi:hypothetical protein